MSVFNHHPAEAANVCCLKSKNGNNNNLLSLSLFPIIQWFNKERKLRQKQTDNALVSLRMRENFSLS